MRPTHQLLNIDVSNILPNADRAYEILGSTEIYFPAIAGELPQPLAVGAHHVSEADP